MIYTSIVIYKHSYEDLKPTLDSLMAAKEITKIILVDNDSSIWARDLQHPKVIYLKSSGNFGFGFGHNLAIKKFAAESKFFLICNPDIYFEVDQFSDFIKFIQTRSEGLFVPKIVYPNGDNQYGARLLPNPLTLFARRFSKRLGDYLNNKYLLKTYDYPLSYFAPNLSGCFMLFNSDSLLRLEGFDERFFMYLEDIDLSRRCAAEFGNLYCPQFTIIHNHEQGSYKNKALLKVHVESVIKYFNKWGWFFDTNRYKLNKNCIKELNNNKKL